MHSAEGGSFSEAARRLGLTPAAVSKNVARLEQRLGVRLFLRSTRRLTLTEAGERFLGQVSGGLSALQAAVDDVAQQDGRPAGTLKLSLGLGFGREHVLPILADFLAEYPAIVPDWTFDNRPVDLIGEGFDAAIGGGFELSPGVVARALAPTHVVAVAAPRYLAGRALPEHPADLSSHDGLLRRSTPTGRIRGWSMRHAVHGEVVVDVPRPRAIFNDPEALAEAARLGMGVALLPMPFVATLLERGDLIRLLPGWYQELGTSWLYYPSRELLPAKTRVFVDFVLARFKSNGFARRMRAD